MSFLKASLLAAILLCPKDFKISVSLLGPQLLVKISYLDGIL